MGTLNSRTGEILILDSFDAGLHPSYLFEDKNHGLIYVLNETDKGQICTLRIKEKGRLEPLHQMQIAGGGPCFGLMLQSSMQILTADYGSGTLCSVELNPGGIPRKSSLFAQFRGKGPDPIRQEASHPHFMLLHEGELFMTDLGMDVIRIFPLTSDGRAGREAREIALKPGAGPRWILPGNADCLYVVEELSSRISTWVCQNEQWLRVQSLSLIHI